MTEPLQPYDQAAPPTTGSTSSTGSTGSTGSTSGTGDGSTTDVAKDQAAQVAGSAKESGQHVADVAKDQAGDVAHEAKHQARRVLGQGQDELRSQAGQQQQRVAAGLRSLGDELHEMARGSSQQGAAADLAHQGADRARSVASWLEDREPGEVLDDVRDFARRRPGAFLGVAAVAGLVVGRLARGLKDGPPEAETGTADGARTPDVAPVARPWTPADELDAPPAGSPQVSAGTSATTSGSQTS